MDEFGVVYVAFGAPYLAMALVSVVSLRVTNPTVQVCVVTNVVRDEPRTPWWKPELGDRWLYLDETTDKNRNFKTGIYRLSPFDLTLYLDCDTMVLDDIAPLSRYLQYFDFLICPAYRPSAAEKRTILGGIFRYRQDGHFNSGVFAFRRGQHIEEFFDLWNMRFHALGDRLDQPALLEALYLGKIRIFPLPAKWNSGDKWRGRAATRNEIVVWHYKMRFEPLIERLLIRAVEWFGGNETHLAEINRFIEMRRELRGQSSMKWMVRRLVARIRGDQSRRLERHPSRQEWIRWTSEPPQPNPSLNQK